MEVVCRRMRPLRMSFEASGRAHHVKLRKLSSPETKDHVARTKHQLAKSEMRRGPFASAPGQALPPSPCPHVLRRRPLRAPSTCSALVIVCSPCSGAANPCGLCPGTCVGTVSSHPPPWPQGGLLYLRASAVCLRPRHASPCTRLELTLPFYSKAPPPAMYPGELQLAFLADRLTTRRSEWGHVSIL